MAKKSKAERIEEKKAKRRDEEQKSKVATESEEPASMTAEEQLEEKRKAEEAQREADLESAKELFGVSVAGSGGHLERMNPNTPEEFEEFRSALSRKITEFEVSSETLETISPTSVFFRFFPISLLASLSLSLSIITISSRFSFFAGKHSLHNISRRPLSICLHTL